MANIHKFSEQMIDVAERLENVADAAQGKRLRKRRASVRWFLLPAVGAGLYALVTRDPIARQAKGVFDGAKARAAELPDDLQVRVQQVTGSAGNAQKGGRQPSKRTGSRSSGRQRSRKTSSAR
jgi:hypothetical protein